MVEHLTEIHKPRTNTAEQNNVIQACHLCDKMVGNMEEHMTRDHPVALEETPDILPDQDPNPELTVDNDNGQTDDPKSSTSTTQTDEVKALLRIPHPAL